MAARSNWVNSRFRLRFCVDVFQSPDAVGRSHRMARFIAAAVGETGVPGGTAAVTLAVASGPARSPGEPVAAQDSAVIAVVATGFGSAGARTGATPRSACTCTC